MILKCIAIDDEPLGLQVVKKYIQKSADLELRAEFTDALDAKKWLEENEVDLIFLDIQMPDITGIQLFKSLDSKPMVIFTTAYSNYAVEGFNLDAVDYLLKPFDFERFQKAVAKAEELYQYRNSSLTDPGYMYIKYDYQWNKIYYKDIQLIEALDDYVKIYLPSKPVLVHISMKGIVEKLPERLFLRVHRSYIVPVQKIESWNKNAVKLKDREIPVSSTYQNSVQEFLSGLIK